MVLILLLPSTTIFAKKTENEKQRIYDFANLLEDDEIQKLEDLSQKYSRRREVDIIVLTTNDTGGKYIEEYMEDFYDEEGLGYNKAHGNTAILSLDMKNRDVNVSGFYKGEEYLDNKRADMVREKITPDLSDGDYYKGFHSFIKTSYKYMGIRPGMNPNNILFKLWFQLAVSLGIAGITVGFMFYNSSGKTTVHEGTYMDSDSSRVLARRDDFVRRSVQKRRKPSSNSSSGSGGSSGGMGGGTSSGGHSHSSSSGKF